jgi:hypothetical protein
MLGGTRATGTDAVREDSLMVIVKRTPSTARTLQFRRQADGSLVCLFPALREASARMAAFLALRRWADQHGTPDIALQARQERTVTMARIAFAAYPGALTVAAPDVPVL